MRNESSLLIKLENLAYNYELLNKLAPQNEVLFMIKANAYGNGITKIYEYAHNELGIKNFGVAALGEAQLIRLNYPKDMTNIYVFSDINFKNKDCLKLYEQANILPVISSREDFDIAIKALRSTRLVLKFNTGMNRLGLELDDLAYYSESLKKAGKSISHLMTHYSSSYLGIERVNATKNQYNKFKKIHDHFKSEGIEVSNTSCANSGAIEQKFSLEENFIRPGLMLYGPYSVGAFKGDQKVWDAKNINSLETKIIKISQLKKGSPIGYGGSVLDKDYKVLTLPLGYGDGLLTYYAGASFNLEGIKAKILGRINMDLVSIGVPIDNNSLKVDNRVRLWGFEQDSIMEFSHRVKTIPYQVMCAVSSRIPRIYL